MPARTVKRRSREAIVELLKLLLDCRSELTILKRMLEQHTTMDRVFHALGDPARRAMIDRLSRGPASVSELARPFDMTLAAVVQHVQVLEQSGVIKTEKIGRVRTCRLEPRGLSAAERWISKRRASWERRFDRLDEFLDESAEPTAPKKGSKES